MFARSRRHLARWFTLSMTSILIIFASIIYYQKTTEQLEALDRLLYKKSSIMAASMHYKYRQSQWQVNLDNVPLLGKKSQSLSSELVYARWYDENRQLIRFYGLPPDDKLTFGSEFLTIKTIDEIEGEPHRVEWLRQITLPVQYNGKTLGYLQVATSITPIQETLREFLLLLAITVPGTIGIIGITGRFLGGMAMQPIRDSYESLQRFTANASHELRSPLAAILSNTQVGLLTLKDEQSPQHRRLQKIAKNAKSMSLLIGNLLFLARHVGRLSSESLKEIELKEWLQQIASSYANQADIKNLKLKYDFPQQSVKLPVEPDLLQQAVGNLLDNACKYTPMGGTIWLRTFVRFNRAIIQIEDSGIGIPPEDLPHVFDRFYRANDVNRSRVASQTRSMEEVLSRHNKSKNDGFGLGLAIAQQIIEAHGGQIIVDSTVGEGSIFQIELPLW
jgi:two-component system, OmpR family, manganese sensing sensor histidine kinase